VRNAGMDPVSAWLTPPAVPNPLACRRGHRMRRRRLLYRWPLAAAVADNLVRYGGCRTGAAGPSAVAALMALLTAAPCRCRLRWPPQGGNG
jgi:hypothetical protein